MKGLLLSGGTGTRLRPLTYSGPKQLLPVANKPILIYAIENLRQAGITDLGIVVGENARHVKEHVKNGHELGVQITYIPQQSPLGLAHAVKTASSFLQDQPFVMILGDTLLDQGIRSFVEHFRSANPVAAVLVSRVKDPEHYGVVQVENKRIVQLVEKPTSFISDLALTGIYAFSPRIHDAIASIVPSARGELEITDALQWLVAHGEEVIFQIHPGWWKDTGRPDDLLEANRLLLHDQTPCLSGYTDPFSLVIGNVRIERGAQIAHSILIGPVAIGRDATIEDAVIGPYTTIGHEAVLRRVELTNSILLDRCHIEGPIRLSRSLIGRETVIHKTKSTSEPAWIHLILGDTSHCEL
ncbi:glucose-1-phosphate thymidylyltransferase [Ferroacidibacillus organovorans]|uniref:Nucleotidyl transferase domain-containing protein n=1 Tax=Ferroacidibacillus organovorans TaxID=1765683 RepID=A0A117SY26_9BACL|nr:glucose-1-phosphate thymidylyltransferase [Ferroacidibacillus organovorans]KUO96286.1 hypothetical protein ATW55_03490 [Ferroacidibacillus organovorans]